MYKNLVIIIKVCGQLSSVFFNDADKKPKKHEHSRKVIDEFKIR